MPTLTRKPAKRGFRIGILLCLGALLALTPMIVAQRTWGIDHPNIRPQDFPNAPQLEKQIEDFTCGVHAMSTIYKAYGLAPKAEKVRERLGADIKALFWLESSRGTFHPDVFMVFAQDYFSISQVDFDAPNPWLQLQNHLENGHLAMLLIKRRETGGLHWVVVQYSSASQIKIFDSLLPAPALEAVDYVENHVLSALLVRPVTSLEDHLHSLSAHHKGSAELKRSMVRFAEAQKTVTTDSLST